MSELWNNRYKNEGEIWGMPPSPSIRILLKELKSNSKVLDYGCGYGRDSIALARNGHNSIGFDLSVEGIKRAKVNVKENNLEKLITFKEASFIETEIAKESFDALHSHRTLHLLEMNKVEDFIKKSAHILKTNSLICISARDIRDFNPSRMEYIESSIAIYKNKNRKGHKIRFWSEELFREKFNRYFDMLSFSQANEIESVSNANEKAYFTIMLARKL